MTALFLVGLLAIVTLAIFALRLVVRVNDLLRENKQLKRDLSEALGLYSSLVRQIKEKNLK